VTSDPGLRFRAVDAFTDLAEALGLAGPLVIGLDDVQWADSSSLLTLAAVARRIAGLPVALLGCLRPVPHSGDLDRVTGVLEAAGARRVWLAPLAGAAVRDLVADAVGAEPGPGLLAETAGADGIAYEERLDLLDAVNHLAPFLLTSLLLPKLTASAPARVVTVTSDAHSAARLDLSDPNLERGWDSWRSYANSKLANILFTRELARRLDGTGVTANCAHPGVVRTGFGRDARPLLKVGVTIARPFMLSPERGADTIVYLASSPDVEDQTGGYYVKRQRREPSAAARDDATAGRLWELSEKMTGLAPARPAGS